MHSYTVLSSNNYSSSFVYKESCSCNEIQYSQNHPESTCDYFRSPNKSVHRGFSVLRVNNRRQSVSIIRTVVGAVNCAMF